jgi:hypothetical protein
MDPTTINYVTLLAWFAIAVVLGCFGNVQWHDVPRATCLADADDSCWTFGYFHAQFAILATLMILGGLFAYKRIAISVPFSDCFLTPGLKGVVVDSRADDRIKGRWLHEVMHIVFTGCAFSFWNYIRQDTGRAELLIGQLPMTRVYVQAWVVVVPTIASEAMALGTYGKLKTNWFVDDAKWAFFSVCLKLSILLVTDFVITADTQMIWSDVDDSDLQLRIVVVAAIVIGIVWLCFWRKVAAVCVDDVHHHLLIQSWACVDFPVTLVLIAYASWGVTARYYNQHDTVSIPVDYIFQLAYSYAVFVGILNTHTSWIVSRGAARQGDRGGGRRQTSCPVAFSVIPQTDSDGVGLSVVPESPDAADVFDAPGQHTMFRAIVCDKDKCESFGGKMFYVH